MSRFKKIKSVINKQKFESWIHVDNKGIFSVALPFTVAEAFARTEVITANNAEDLEHEFLRIMREYDRLTVQSIYRIKYRIMLSKKIKLKMPSSVMTDQAWQESGRLGGEYIPEKSLTVLIDWFPIEIRVKGKEEVVTRLMVPDEDDFSIRGAKEANEKGEDGELYLMNIHKPYDGLILVSDERVWDFDDSSKMYKDIPLTQDTFEFFTSIEDSFIAMLTKLFSFLNRDEKKLMADITNAIQSGVKFLER